MILRKLKCFTVKRPISHRPFGRSFSHSHQIFASRFLSFQTSHWRVPKLQASSKPICDVPILVRDYSTFKVSDTKHFFRSGILSIERKGKGNKGGKSGKRKDEEDDEEREAFEFDVDEQRPVFQPAVDHLKREFESLKINRVSPSLLDSVNVQTGDGLFPLTKIGQVIIKDPQTLQVTVYDEQHLKPAEKAVRDSPIGLTPLIEAGILKVKVPKPTKEYRESVVKLANQQAENAKNAIRSARKNCLDKVKKAKPSQDDERAAEKQIQSLVDEYNKIITTMLNAKVKELTNV